MSGNILGLVPARGGSKGIRRKNIRDVAGVPLIGHSIRAANGAEAIDRTLVSTDDEEIRSVARKYGAEVPFLRPAELAVDETPMEPVIQHAVEYVRSSWGGKWDTLALLQPTSPVRDSADIDGAVERFHERKADSLVSVYEDHSYRWERTEDGGRRKNYRGDRKRRQEKSPEFVETGGIYIVDIDTFLRTGNLQTGRTELYVVDRSTAVDIDTDFELWLARQILTDWIND